MGGAATVDDRPADIAEPSEDERRLLRLLATGVSDEVAAAELAWSRRTLERRLKVVMDRLEARSRFQAGCLASRLGWIDEEG